LDWRNNSPTLLELEINRLWCAEECRSRGLGSLLLIKTEEPAKTKGAHKLLLPTPDFQARPFYKAESQARLKIILQAAAAMRWWNGPGSNRPKQEMERKPAESVRLKRNEKKLPRVSLQPEKTIRCCEWFFCF